jgi:hypothetical protein
MECCTIEHVMQNIPSEVNSNGLLRQNKTTYAIINILVWLFMLYILCCCVMTE